MEGQTLLRGVDHDRFLPADRPQWPGHWSNSPQPWSMGPEGTTLDRETLAVLRRALGFTDLAPTANLVTPAPNSQFPPR
jgi:hypothetical protein